MKRLFLLLVALTYIAPAQAHNRGTSYSFWTITEQGAEVCARVSQLELTRLQLEPALTQDYPQRVSALLTQQIGLWSQTGACQSSDVAPPRFDGGWLELRWRLRCDGMQQLSIRSRLLHEVAPSHLHFVRVTLPGGEIRQRVLTYAEPAMPLALTPAAAPPASLTHYIGLGIEHILSGWDHLAFVLALVLLAASLREVAIVATGFTIAHSLTLAAAVLGGVATRAEVVEALIGFSIALVAAENLWLRAGKERWLPWTLALALVVLALFGLTRLAGSVLAGLALFTLCYFALLRIAARPARWRLALAFVFGLVHGFGFAGVMGELQLPPAQLALGLLGFNTGVELGQLAVIALAWPLLRALRRLPVAAHWIGEGGSAVICALGTYWFLTRAILT